MFLYISVVTVTVIGWTAFLQLIAGWRLIAEFCVAPPRCVHTYVCVCVRACARARVCVCVCMSMCVPACVRACAGVRLHNTEMSDFIVQSALPGSNLLGLGGGFGLEKS